MALNPGLILAQNQPNFMNALMQGTQAAAATNQVRDQNRLRTFNQEQGAALMNGDQNALAQYAGINPQGAMQIKAQQEAAQRARAAAARAAAAAARNATAQEAAKEREAYQRGVQALSMATTPEQWDRNAAALGIPQLAGAFNDREIIMAEAMGVIDALKVVEAQTPEVQQDPAAIQALKFRATEAGLTPGTPEYQEFMVKGGKLDGGMSLVVTPDGGVQFGQGSGAGALPAQVPKLTVEAGKNTGFYLRMQEANEVLNALEGQGTRFVQQNLDSMPLGTGNYFRTPEFQQFDQARRDFVNALLRRESGAVISDQEFANAEIQYFPQPGDSPQVIAQKARNRETAIEGIRIGSGEGGAYVDQSGFGATTQPAAQPDPSLSPDRPAGYPPASNQDSVGSQRIDELLRRYGGG